MKVQTLVTTISPSTFNTSLLIDFPSLDLVTHSPSLLVGNQDVHIESVASGHEITFGENTNKSTCTADIASAPSHIPVQPNSTYPSTHYKDGKKRKFNADWYLMYSWLEYSVERNLIYCFACRHFPTEFTHGSNSAKLFSREGFGDWKHASGRNGALQRHETSIVHIKSIIAWKEYKLLQESNKTLPDMFNSARKENVKNNRHYLKGVNSINTSRILSIS